MYNVHANERHSPLAFFHSLIENSGKGEISDQSCTAQFQALVDKLVGNPKALDMEAISAEVSSKVGIFVVGFSRRP
jgi:hypothetical protein